MSADSVGTRTPVPGSLSAVLDWHLEHYPLLRAEDVYKLVHQGVFGPGHLMKDAHRQPLPAHGLSTGHQEHAMREALERELLSLIPNPHSLLPPSLTEPLDPDGILVRLNLEPLRFQPDAVDKVLRALLETCRTLHGSQEKMAENLDAASVWCAQSLPDQCDRLSELAGQSAESGYPPRHHSAVYVAAYRPAYRVVRADLLEELGTGD